MTWSMANGSNRNGLQGKKPAEMVGEQPNPFGQFPMRPHARLSSLIAPPHQEMNAGDGLPSRVRPNSVPTS